MERNDWHVEISINILQDDLPHPKYQETTEKK